MPLVMTHGGPGSIVEFQKVIEPLTDPQTPDGGHPDRHGLQHFPQRDHPLFASLGRKALPQHRVVDRARRTSANLLPLNCERRSQSRNPIMGSDSTMGFHHSGCSWTGSSWNPFTKFDRTRTGSPTTSTIR